MRTPLRLEAFESRIVPAAVVKFTEVDGDTVTVRTNQGTTADLEQAIGFVSGQEDVDGFRINLSGTPALAETFEGTNIKIVKGRGNRLADKVVIEARGIDLGNIGIKGNLSQVNAGDATVSTLALARLTVTNWLPGGVTYSAIHGDIGSIVVKETFEGGLASVSENGQAFNYQDADGTVIGSFTCKTFGGPGSSFTGWLQVRGLEKLTITERFFGESNFVNNGLIQAVSIGKTSINAWEGDARVELG